MALKPTTEGTVSPLPAAARSSKSSCLALACGPRRNLRNAIWFCKVSKMKQQKKSILKERRDPLRLALGLHPFCHGQIGANLQVQELDLLRIFIKVGKRITTEFLLPQQWMEVEDSEQDVSGIGILNRILNCIQYSHDYKFQTEFMLDISFLAAKIMIPKLFATSHCFTDDSTYHSQPPRGKWQGSWQRPWCHWYPPVDWCNRTLGRLGGATFGWENSKIPSP